MTLIANSSGVVSGKFTVPGTLPAGSHLVTFDGAGGSSGAAFFAGQGTLVRQTFQSQTTETETRWQSPPPPPPSPVIAAPAGVPWTDEEVAARLSFLRGGRTDPLAQTFTLNEAMSISGVDLWFSAKGTTRVEVQIRETTTGFPDNRILSRKRVELVDISVGGISTRIAFDRTVRLRAGQEYAIVVLCDDAVSALSIAELGKFDTASQRWVTSQPYQVGVLLSSSNAVTWTAHQDRDLAFRLLRARHTQTQRTINLGKVTVANATDLMLMAFADRPTSDAIVDYLLTLPDASILPVSDGQPIRLPAAITGDVSVSAVLRGNENAAPVLHPGIQVAAGTVATSANYITRAVLGGTGIKVRVIYEALIPSGATVTPQYRGIDAGDSWVNVPQTGTMNMDNGWIEFSHEATGVNESMVHVQLLLTGTTAARPRVRNLRFMTV